MLLGHHCVWAVLNPAGCFATVTKGIEEGKRIALFSLVSLGWERAKARGEAPGLDPGVASLPFEKEPKNPACCKSKLWAAELLGKSFHKTDHILNTYSYEPPHYPQAYFSSHSHCYTAEITQTPQLQAVCFHWWKIWDGESKWQNPRADIITFFSVKQPPHSWGKAKYTLLRQGEMLWYGNVGSWRGNKCCCGKSAPTLAHLYPGGGRALGENNVNPKDPLCFRGSSKEFCKGGSWSMMPHG